MRDVLDRLMETYFRRLRQYALQADEDDTGRIVTGETPFRPASEDVQAEVDAQAEGLFLETLRQFQREVPGLQRVAVHSESHPNGNPAAYVGDAPQYRVYLDPIDGTDEFLRGLDTSLYSAMSWFTGDGQPVAAGTYDVWADKVYLARPGGATLVFGSGARKALRPAQAKRLPEQGVVLGYLGRWKYLAPWVRGMSPLLAADGAKGLTLHGKGGSFVYGFIGSGKALCYVMWDEPVSEILPGLAFAQLVGFPVLVRKRNGSVTPFSLREHGGLDHVPALVTACTEELARAIIRGVQWG